MKFATGELCEEPVEPELQVQEVETTVELDEPSEVCYRQHFCTGCLHYHKRYLLSKSSIKYC
jgi:hypothetical protein